MDIEILGLNPEFFVLWYSRVAESHNKVLGEINLIFCSDEYLLRLNRELLNHDYFTDIITVDNSFLNVISGDLYISIERVRDNAAVLKNSFEKELLRVCVHGVLHLCGLKDKTSDETKEMRDKESFWLNNVPRETLLL